MLTASLQRGFTIIEMLVAMTVGGVALALIAAVSLRQQRTFTDLANQAAVAQQLREASAILPLTLRSLSPSTGDLRDARDTAFEFRSTIATALVCDTTTNALILPPIVAGSSIGAIESPIEAGDSLWLYSSTANAWLGASIASVATATAGACASRGPILTINERVINRTIVRFSSPLPVMIGMPIRITRPLRLSLYRASDGAWYLGQRDWNNATARFNTIQPVAGPLLSPGSGGLVFRYSDASGAAMTSPVASLSAIAMVRVEMRAQSSAPMQVLRSARGVTRPVDSSIVVVGFRSRE